ncbi:ABC transporter permease [Exiguobacterium sp. TRN 1102]|mgnify:CR=1 FL=1|uniref:ABC transporter permease n=1 Tax=unclassified Exiguobacterium TaxID=2644629 RepID=UPI000939BC8F|nr:MULTISPECIES: ABC transporter permease [unclassified Exiguobacterium]
MIKASKQVFIELWESLYLILRLSVYETKSRYSMQYFGYLWEIITPIIQIAIYWLVFGFGLRAGRDVGDVPFLPWLVSGIVPWFFFGPAIVSGSRSVFSKIALVSKMSFPISTIPAYVILSELYRHVAMVVIAFILMMAFGISEGWNILFLPYLLISALAFLYAFALLTSALATIIRDFQNLLSQIIRMMLYLLPIFWQPSGKLELILMANPLYYLVEGYRSMFLGTDWIMQNLTYGLYFWGFTFVTFLIGSAIHVRFRRYFIDYI